MYGCTALTQRLKIIPSYFSLPGSVQLIPSLKKRTER